MDFVAVFKTYGACINNIKDAIFKILQSKPGASIFKLGQCLESEKCGDLGFSMPDQRNSLVRRDGARLATCHLAADCCLHSLVSTSGEDPWGQPAPSTVLLSPAPLPPSLHPADTWQGGLCVMLQKGSPNHNALS